MDSKLKYKRDSEDVILDFQNLCIVHLMWGLTKFSQKHHLVIKDRRLFKILWSIWNCYNE